jgi:enamine deaminase RidA (YjgF/YER057c/UK114 family)
MADHDAASSALNPPSLAPPAAAYSHAMVTGSGYRWVHTSGVVPVRPDGTVPASLPEQAARVWSNIATILAEAGMDLGDVVSVTTYVVAGEDLSPVMAARDAAMAGHRPASTLVTVPALAQPAWRLEIAVVAART